LAFGCWPLAVGLWLLTFGCWPLVVGLWLLAADSLLPAKSQQPTTKSQKKVFQNGRPVNL